MFRDRAQQPEIGQLSHRGADEGATHLEGPRDVALGQRCAMEGQQRPDLSVDRFETPVLDECADRVADRAHPPLEPVRTGTRASRGSCGGNPPWHQRRLGWREGG